MKNTQVPGRRDFLRTGIALGASLTVAALWAEVARAAPTPVTDDSQLLDVVSDLVIPATNIPGARAAKVPAFLALAIEHQTLGAKGDEVGRLRKELDVRSHGSFVALAADRQFKILEALDASCFPPHSNQSSAWPEVKTLILAGYYGSEIGASKDQHYDLDPGRYDADIPYHEGDPAFNNDWAGVAFR